MQSSDRIVPANKPIPNFLQAGCPICRPTNSVKALKGKNIAFHGLANPIPICGSSNIVFDHERFLLILGRVADPLVSHAIQCNLLRFSLIACCQMTHIWVVSAGARCNGLSVLHCALASGAVYCNRSCLCLWQCLFVCVFVGLLPR